MPLASIRPSCLGACVVACIAASASFSPPAGAQAGRLFLSVPRGSDLLLFTYSGSRSNAWADETIPDPGTQSRVRSLSVAYAAIMEIDGHTAGPGISIPYSALKSIDNVSGEVTAQTQGLGDIAFTFDYNFFGAPSMSPEEFRLFTPVTYSGIHFILSAPSGRYDPDASTNVGSNRWSLRALVNYSYTWDEGDSWIDFYPSVRVFTANPDYLGQHRLTQSPLYGLEAHYSTTLWGRTWASVGAIGSWGGRVDIDGTLAVSDQTTIRAALGGGTPLWAGAALILAANSTIYRSPGAVRAKGYMVQVVQRF